MCTTNSTQILPYIPSEMSKKFLLDGTSSETDSQQNLVSSIAPVFTAVRARGGAQLSMQFIPVCANGQYTKTPDKVALGGFSM